MSAVIRYALAGLAVVVLGCLALWMLLDETGRTGTLFGALIAYPIQVMAFWLLLRARDQVTRFFTWWGVGIALRVAVVVAAGILTAGMETAQRAPLLLSMIGFFLALVLLEPLFLRAGREDVRTA